MKVGRLTLSLLLIGLGGCLLVARGPRKAGSTDGSKPVDPRKLLLSFYWNSNEKRYVQRERMKELMKNTMKNLMERYQFEAHLDQWNHETMEDIHRQYNKAKSNIQLAKHFLVEKMDNIYNNFIQPARWFY